MKFCLVQSILLFIILYIVSSLSVFGQDELYGVWLEKDKSKVAVIVENCGEELCGYIYWLKKPFSSNGQPKVDKHNPEESKRNNPRCGLKILSGFSLEKNNKRFKGTIYNPSNGRIYNSIIRINDKNNLIVSGYVGLPFFGVKTTWVRPTEKLTQCSLFNG